MVLLTTVPVIYESATFDNQILTCLKQERLASPKQEEHLVIFYVIF